YADANRARAVLERDSGCRANLLSASGDCVFQLRADFCHLVLAVPYALWAVAPRGGRTPGSRICTRNACEPAALHLHHSWRGAGRAGGRIVFAGDQTGLVEPAGHARRWLDCAGNRHFWWLASLSGCARRLLVRSAAGAFIGNSAQPGHSNSAGAAERLTVDFDADDADTGEQRRSGTLVTSAA